MGLISRVSSRTYREMKNVLCVGDSITELSWGTDGNGWAAVLQDHFQRRAQIITRGYGGYSSQAAVDYFDHLHVLPELKKSIKQTTAVSGHNPSAAIVFYGANDSVLRDCKDNGQHVPVPIFTANLEKIIKHLKVELMITYVILITLPMYDVDAWLPFIVNKYNLAEPPESKRNNENSTKYRQAVLDLADKTNSVLVCDLWNAMERRADWKDCLCDGLHFSPKGQRLLADTLIPILEPLLPAYEDYMPNWKDL